MPAARSKKRRATSPARAEATDEYADQLRGFFAAKEWQALAEAVEKTAPEESEESKGYLCRAFVHLESPSDAVVSLARAYSEGLLKGKADHVDALLCRSALLAKDGQAKASGDTALEALKASTYKDQDAIKLLTESQKGGHEQTKEQDPYAILHVARTAPDSVIKAAHKAHGHAKGSDEAKAADEAYALLSTKEKRAEYDSKPANRSTGGTGFDVEGGSDLLAQLGRALGLKFPEGFVWPASGRFQGGFGGGFEYTWGETEAKAEGAESPCVRTASTSLFVTSRLHGAADPFEPSADLEQLTTSSKDLPLDLSFTRLRRSIPKMPAKRKVVQDAEDKAAAKETVKKTKTKSEKLPKFEDFEKLDDVKPLKVNITAQDGKELATFEAAPKVFNTKSYGWGGCVSLSLTSRPLTTCRNAHVRFEVEIDGEKRELASNATINIPINGSKLSAEAKGDDDDDE